MPNNPYRHKAGVPKVSSGSVKAKRKDVATSITTLINRAFVTTGQEQGAGNSTPAPTFTGTP